MKRWLERGAIALAGIAVLGGAVVVSGVVPVKASSGHFEITAWFLHFAMKRSIATHSFGIDAPELDDPRLVLMGAGHYEGGCRPCHGAPGTGMPRIPAAMTPLPPELSSKVGEYDDEDLFYLVRHGVKFTGMPAWPSQKREDEVWSVVAFLRRLPSLDADGYRRLVHGDPSAIEGAPSVVVERCARCHGADGLGRGEGAFPRLAGQKPVYLRRALEAYAIGTRHSGIMEPIAASLDRAAIEQAVEWYASRPLAIQPIEGDVTTGEAIATRGVPKRRIPSCSDCHGPEQRTHEAYPRLAGQYPEYLVRQLELFTKGARGGSEYARIMQTIVAHAKLEAEEIEAVARYYASLPAEEEP
jgi:cytochrome c553